MLLTVWVFTARIVLDSSMSYAQEKTDVVVVGSGLAGLITTYELEKNGLSCHILELKDRLGGRIATATYGEGLVAEYGMHEIWNGCPLLKYVEEFHLPLSSPEQPYSSVIIQDKLYPYVQDTFEEYLKTIFTPEEIVTYYKWRTATEKVYDQTKEEVLTSELAPLQEISYAEWINELQLPEKVCEFVRLTLESELATDWSNVSALYGIMQLRQFVHETEQCQHITTGNTTLIDTFAMAIKAKKTLNAKVTRIVRREMPDGTHECKVYYLKNSKLECVEASNVVVAVAWNYLHLIQMDPGLTEEQWQAINTLESGEYSVVHFIMDTKANEMFKTNGKLSFPILSRGPLGVIYGIVGKPSENQTEEVFTLLIHGKYAMFYLDPQDKIKKDLISHLEKIWPGFSQYVKAAYFYGYHPGATPSWPVGRSPLDAKSKSLQKPVAGLYLVGDYIYSNHADGAVISAQKVAQIISNAKKK